jgi:DNA mismatch repair protein PMS2
LSADLKPPPHFSKNDFLNLTIVGQFNMGFIVCIFNSEFYIVDQHAASEKANY